MSSIVGFSSGNSEWRKHTSTEETDEWLAHRITDGDRYRMGIEKVWYLINLICFPWVNICNYIHLLLVILPTRCAFERMEHRHLLRKHTSQICEAQLYLILFYSHSMNQPKYICLCGKGFRINIKMGLNQITFADRQESFSSVRPRFHLSHIHKNIRMKAKVCEQNK